MPGTDVAYGLAGECEAGGSDVEHGGDGAEEDDFAPQIIIHEPVRLVAMQTWRER